jgi:HAD superfamily hydrolase (TIGR01509 family)
VITAVIFDVDGTLIDSVDLHAQAWQEIFKQYGKEIAFDDVRGQIGKGGDQLMPVFFSKEELDDFGEEMEEARGELFKTKYMPKIKPFPQVRELFERIRRDDKKIALASSAVEHELEHFKKLLNISDLLAGDTNADDAEKSKPHPDIFEAALKEIGNPPVEEVIVIGDTPYDAEAAGKANLRTIGVLAGGFPEKQLTDAGCIAIFRDPADLLARYDESPLANNSKPNSATTK